jgi:signal transduction histidine kinase
MDAMITPFNLTPGPSTAVSETERLRRLVATKDQFLALVSHELRTPLTPILMFSEMLELDPNLDIDQREAVETIHSNAVLATRLITDLLDLSRATFGKLHLTHEPVDMHASIAHAQTTMHFDALRRDVTLGARLEASARVVMGDPDRLMQILINLLSNAVKFTPDGGSVVVRTWDAAQDRIAIEVRDTGLGIDAERLGRLFEPLYQAPEERGAAQHGLGLGLAITRMLVEAHGGTISAASAGIGAGATFTVTLPALTRG